MVIRWVLGSCLKVSRVVWICLCGLVRLLFSVM